LSESLKAKQVTVYREMLEVLENFRPKQQHYGVNRNESWIYQANFRRRQLDANADSVPSQVFVSIETRPQGEQFNSTFCISSILSTIVQALSL
jgi:hypothetical protein